MNKKPSLQEFLSNNPEKGVNDYFKAYGHIEEAPKVQPVVTTPQPKPIQNIAQDNTLVVQPRSYIKDSSSKDKAKIDFLNIIASIAAVAAFFLPWINIEGFEKVEEEITIVNGIDMYSIFNAFSFEVFSDLSYYTIYFIPLGAIIALIGELMRNWAIRIIGQMLSISFACYWGYKIYYLFAKAEIRPEEMESLDFVQYGFMILAVGILLYFVDIMRTTFGNNR